MNSAFRLLTVLALAAIFILALDFYDGGESPIEVKASDCASGRSYAPEAQKTEAAGPQEQAWPGDSLSIHDNRPCFRWPENYKVDNFEIQLSRSQNFSDHESTATYLVPATCFRPEHPLIPGEWYWRVRPQNGWGWSPTWHFTQSAPVEADTTGPQISPVSLSITRPDQSLQFKVSDPSGVLTNSLTVQGIKDKSFEITRNVDYVDIKAVGGWPRGAHHLRLQATDQLGNQTTKYFWVAVAPAPPESLQWLSRQGVFNGATCSFPMGIFHAPAKDFAKVKAAGFTMVHKYDWEDFPHNTNLLKYLDAAAANGLKAFVGFDRGLYSKKGLMKMHLEDLARRVAAVRDHPALLAWYIYDEPDHEHQYVAPRNLKAAYDLLKLLDPYHPVVLTFAFFESIEKYGQDCYDAYWIMAYDDTITNDKRITTSLSHLEPKPPIMLILGALDDGKSQKLRAGQEVEDQNFKPDYTHMRADAYLALTYGSSGLAWWWYGDNRKEYVSVGDTPEAWTWLSRVVKEINQLAPLLNSPSVDLPIQIKSAPPEAMVRARAFKNGSQITIIAVNTHPSQETKATIQSQHFPEQAAAAGKFGTPKSEINGQELRISLPPLAAHVYEVKP